MQSFTVSAQFPVRPFQVLNVRDGNGRVVEQITEIGEGRTFTRDGVAKKKWDVSISPVAKK